MAPNPPACCFIHASMAGSRSTAPLNRSNSVLIAAPLAFSRSVVYVASLAALEQNPDGNRPSCRRSAILANAAIFYNLDLRLTASLHTNSGIASRAFEVRLIGPRVARDGRVFRQSCPDGQAPAAFARL